MVLSLLCLGGLSLGSLAACSDYGEDIDAAKAAVIDGMTGADFVTRLAGPDGSVQWSGRRPDHYAEGSSIVLVEAKVDKLTRAGAARRIVLQYIYNRVTERVTLYDVVVDGESQGILGASLRMLLLRFE